MCVNVNKSQCIQYGWRYNIHCSALTTITVSGVIKWVYCCSYLGVLINSSCNFKCNFDNIKSCFFRTFNALSSKVGRLASEKVVLSLIRAKCLPILSYATDERLLLSRIHLNLLWLVYSWNCFTLPRLQL